MEMTIDEIITKEIEIAQEFQKVVDTHIVNDNGFTIDEMYCDDTEVIEEELKKCQKLLDYHNTIANTMRKYQKIQEQVELSEKENHKIDVARMIQIREFIYGNDT